MIVPSFLINQAEIAKGVKKVEKKFKPDVVRIFHTIRENWMGDPALYFHVLLSDEVADKMARDFAKRKPLSKYTRTLEETMEKQIDPLGKWGLFPYFSYRSVSEQAELKDRDWESDGAA